MKLYFISFNIVFRGGQAGGVADPIVNYVTGDACIYNERSWYLTAKKLLFKKANHTGLPINYLPSENISSQGVWPDPPVMSA